MFKHMNIAIIGAGLSGLACADRLQMQGHRVQLFDKARGAGGRMSTRRISTEWGEVSFDHGAQYFTVRDANFKTVVDQWQSSGAAAPWPVVGPDAWVGTPSMSAPIKWMATRHDVTWSIRVEAIQRQDNGWVLRGEGAPHTCFDAVVIAVPAEQAAALLTPIQNDFATLAKATVSSPCWTLMLSFASPLQTRTITLCDDAIISWAACNSDKPARTGPQSWVIQASAAWSEKHLEDSPDAVQAMLMQRFAECLAVELPVPLIAATHRWRYALSGNAGCSALYSPGSQLGVCGDWFLGPRVECAWLSGQALGMMIGTSASKHL